MATVNISIQQGIAGAIRVLPIIDDVPEVTERVNAKKLNLNEGKIEFEKVVFKYPKTDKSILNNLNLTFAGGKMTALVGHSGAGKSTILNLIPRFFDLNDGDIKLDKQSIYGLKINSLRKNISLVSQDTTLFDDTIKNNIIYANLNASKSKWRKLQTCHSQMNLLKSYQTNTKHLLERMV